MNLAAGQAPQQKTYPRCQTRACPAPPSPARHRDVVEQPGDLGGRRSRDRISSPVALGSIFCGLAADSAAADTGAVRAILSHTIARWMGRPVVRSHTIVVSRWLVIPMAASAPALTRRVQAPPGCGDRRNPDVLRIVLDQSRRREVLCQFTLRQVRRPRAAVEGDGAGRRRSLVDCEHVPGHPRHPSAPTQSPQFGIRSFLDGRPVRRILRRPVDIAEGIECDHTIDWHGYGTKSTSLGMNVCG